MIKIWIVMMAMIVAMPVSFAGERLTFKQKMEAMKAKKAAKKEAELKAETAENGKFLDSIESKVFTLKASKDEIMERAQDCMESILNYDDVDLSDGTASALGVMGALLSGPTNYNRENVIPGGDVIKKFDAQRGRVIANSRIAFSKHLIGHNIQSNVIVFVKDGKFKIKHDNIKEAQTGSSSSGYLKIRKSWGAGWEASRDELIKKTNEIEVCIQNKTAQLSDDW